MRVDGVFTDQFFVKSSLDIEPYNLCLLDVSQGIPDQASLKNFGLDESHNWKVDQLEFYEELRIAKRFSVKKTFCQLDKISSSTEESKFISTQAKILMWKAEQQMKDDKTLTEKIDRLQAKKRAEFEEDSEKGALKQLGYSDEPGSDSYYAKYGAH